MSPEQFERECDAQGITKEERKDLPRLYRWQAESLKSFRDKFGAKSNMEALNRIDALLSAQAPAKKKGSLKEIVQQQCREASKVPIPILLLTPAFQEAWMEFCSHRCRIANKGRIQDGRKHPWNPAAATRILNACEKMGAAKAMAGMELAIEKDWLDIHYDETPTPRTYGKPATNQRPATGGTNAGRYSSK